MDFFHNATTKINLHHFLWRYHWHGFEELAWFIPWGAVNIDLNSDSLTENISKFLFNFWDYNFLLPCWSIATTFRSVEQNVLIFQAHCWLYMDSIFVLIPWPLVEIDSSGFWIRKRSIWGDLKKNYNSNKRSTCISQFCKEFNASFSRDWSGCHFS